MGMRYRSYLKCSTLIMAHCLTLLCMVHLVIRLLFFARLVWINLYQVFGYFQRHKVITQIVTLLQEGKAPSTPKAVAESTPTFDSPQMGRPDTFHARNLFTIWKTIQRS